MKRRRGISLIELLVVMSAAALILTTSARLIRRIMLASSQAKALADIERTSLRLANAFRRDVHGASGASIADAADATGVFLRLKLPENQTIEYRHEPAAVLRILLANDKPIAREEFALPAGIELSIRQDEAGLPTLSISSRPGELSIGGGHSEPSAFALPVSLEVAALVARDHLDMRLTTAPGGSP